MPSVSLATQCSYSSIHLYTVPTQQHSDMWLHSSFRLKDNPNASAFVQLATQQHSFTWQVNSIHSPGQSTAFIHLASQQHSFTWQVNSIHSPGQSTAFIHLARQQHSFTWSVNSIHSPGHSSTACRQFLC